jgi:hypothetical protein
MPRRPESSPTTRTIVKNTFGKERSLSSSKETDRGSHCASDERKDWNKIRILGYLKGNLNENSSRNKYVTCYNDNDEPCRTCCSSSIYSKDKQSRSLGFLESVNVHVCRVSVSRLLRFCRVCICCVYTICVTRARVRLNNRVRKSVRSYCSTNSSREMKKCHI